MLLLCPEALEILLDSLQTQKLQLLLSPYYSLKVSMKLLYHWKTSMHKVSFLVDKEGRS